MAKPSPAQLRAFVRRNTRLVEVADVPGLRLHLADDVTTLWRRSGDELHDADPALPFWGFAWSGGLAIARYLVDRPEEVEGRRVLDVACGSGLCGISAALLGAASVEAVDVDPLAEAAVAVNAHANRVRIGFARMNAAASAAPDRDVVLAGDVCYEETMAGDLVRWLRAAAERGARVLIGDPGRAYLPLGLRRLATYRVRTSREIESAAVKDAAVYTFVARG